MSIMSWNCQGMGSPQAIRRLREMRRQYFPDFLFLMETKNSSRHVLNAQGWLGYDHSHIVDPEGLSGGLVLFWKAAYEVEVLHSDKRIIDVKVTLGSLMFFISFVYGDPVQHLRQAVLERLTEIGIRRTDAWFVVGDLNELMDNSEKLGGPPRAEASFYPFRNMIQDCRLREIPSFGNRFSWAGVRNHVWVQCRLDRAFGNSEWFNLFPRAQAEYLDRMGSDHRPLFTRFVHENLSHSGRFVFDRRWVSKPEIAALLREEWNRESSNETRLLSDKIAECRRVLSKWRRGSDSNSKTKIKRLRDKLEREEVKINPNFQLLKNLKWELTRACHEEEIYWKQKSKEKWLKEGDRNTRFFHGSVQRRRVRNKILSLITDNGIEQFSEGSKGDIAVKYFRKMFTSSHPKAATNVLSGMEPRVTDTMNRELIKPVTSEEIRDAAFAIKGDKAPGPDGMTGQFFQSYWTVVGQQVIDEVKGFFLSGSFPLEWNYTNICLIPKKSNPNKMSDLRPISLCSVSYKIISKVLCSRLKHFLPEIVSDTQGAFVSGRLISDNILIAHEMVHALRTKASCNEDYMAIKTDMSKAYDRVEWNFLEQLFTKLGFDSKWIEWVMFCVRSVSYSVLLNGNSYGLIKPERGLRQGDPLSPFLFILCAEALVHIMNKSENEERISGLRLTKNSPSIQHLLFADDSLFLCRATFKECLEILRCLKLYGEVSGQEINFQKSSITYGGKIDPIMRHLLGLLMGINKEGGAGTYLGLPECFSGSKGKLLAFISDRLRNRLSGWYEKTLSLGGKEVLLKSVAMALPVYAMSCFKMTKYQCQQITSAMSNFWWNECEGKKKMHWVSWDKICKSKNEGGLGFRDIGDFNQALLAKQAWRILNEPQSLLARVYKARYFDKKDIINASTGSRPSYAWRSILHGRDLLKRGLMRSIGNGVSTTVWMDKWILDGNPRRPANKQRLIDISLMVSHLITPQGCWNQQKILDLFPPEDATRIMSLSPALNLQDRDIWAYTKDGSYSVKSGSWLQSHMNLGSLNTQAILQPINVLKSRVWRVKTVPKIQLFMWRALSGALAVSECLNSHGLHVNPICQVCGMGLESVCHVLFKCTASQQVWALAKIFPPPQGFSNSLSENMDYILTLMENDRLPAARKISIPWILWGIWKNRNATLIAGKTGDLKTLVSLAMEEATNWSKQNEVAAREHNRAITRTNLMEKMWSKPVNGIIKCNVSSSWINSSFMCGGAWIARDDNGATLFHARDAFLPAFNKITATLRCILWMLQSVSDLHLTNIEVWSDCAPAIEALNNPEKWPRYRTDLGYINNLLPSFSWCKFKASLPQANSIARDIAKSVTRDGRFQSYLALGGPNWLHARIVDESRC